jgi:putative oxidoreductase
MNDGRADRFALLFLRFIAATGLLLHAELNIGGIDPADAAAWLGLPSGVPAFVVRLELVIAVALVLGIWTRAAALAGVGILLGAVLTVRCPPIFANPSFNWTTPARWIGVLLLLSLAGGGTFALLPTPFHSQKEKRP